MLTISVLFLIIIWNYLKNVFIFQGLDVSQMYEPVKLLALSYNRTYWDADTVIILTMLYPFLVTLAAGFSYVKEQQTKEEIYLITRAGERTYMLTKILSAFFATFLIFTVPFLTELLMNMVSFPLKARGDLTNFSIYSSEYVEMVHHYLGSRIYMISPLLYAVMGIFMFGLCSGILAALTVAISFHFSVKYRVFLFFPVFILLNGSVYANELLPGGARQISWFEYLLLFNDNNKYNGYLPIAIMILLILTAGLYQTGKRRERY